jgi:hypothetical protein
VASSEDCRVHATGKPSRIVRHQEGENETLSDVIYVGGKGVNWTGGRICTETNKRSLLPLPISTSDHHGSCGRRRSNVSANVMTAQMPVIFIFVCVSLRCRGVSFH